MVELEKRFLEVHTAYIRRISLFLRNYSYDDKEIGLDIFIIDYLGEIKSCTMKEITTFLKVKFPSTATKRIDRLVDFGFVDRTNSDKDRRKVEIRLTENGKQLYDDFLRARLKAMSIIMENFEKDKLHTYLSIIERLVELDKEINLEVRLEERNRRND